MDSKQEQEVNAIHGDDEAGIEDLTTENAPLVSVILQMRLYDVMLALLNNVDEESATLIATAHDQGLILTGPPFFAGFATGE